MKKFKCKNLLDNNGCSNRFGAECDYNGRCSTNCNRYNYIYQEDRKRNKKEINEKITVSNEGA